MMDNLKNNSQLRLKQQDAKEKKEQEVKYAGTLPEDTMLDFEATAFECDGKTKRTTNKELCELIKAKFRGVFHDLYGVMIDYAGGRFMVSMYFRNNPNPTPENMIKNFVSLTQLPSGSKNIYDKSKIASNNIAGKFFTLSDETKLLLSDFMIRGRYNNKWDSSIWDTKHIKPFIYDPSKDVQNIGLYAPGYLETFIKVENLDLRLLLKHCLYGSDMVVSTEVTADGKIVNKTTPAKYDFFFGDIIDFNTKTFSMNIDQFNQESVQRRMNEEHPGLYKSYKPFTCF